LDANAVLLFFRRDHMTSPKVNRPASTASCSKDGAKLAFGP
jgi:hypothetical protein